MTLVCLFASVFSQRTAKRYDAVKRFSRQLAETSAASRGLRTFLYFSILFPNVSLSFLLFLLLLVCVVTAYSNKFMMLLSEMRSLAQVSLSPIASKTAASKDTLLRLFSFLLLFSSALKSHCVFSLLFFGQDPWTTC